MSLISRFSTGWKISMDSLKLLKNNKQLIIFPILSGASIIVLTASFAFASVFAEDSVMSWVEENNADMLLYLGAFVFYLINYFIVIFFNVALMHCLRLYFTGEDIDVSQGFSFAFSRISAIFSWAVIAATVGTILKVVQEETGIVGKIITAVLGVIWNITTFFVVPVIAYENAGPFEAIKRSSKIIKDKWGESLSGNFSLGLVQIIAMLIIAVPLYIVGAMINPVLGIGLAVIACLLVFTVMSAAQGIFISAVYHHAVLDRENEVVSSDTVEDLFSHR